MPTRDELFLAYRQAKTALFFERRGIGLIDLARFEQNLTQRLDALSISLSENGGWFDGLPAGEVWVVPKRLRPEITNSVIRIGGRPSSKIVPGLDIQLRYSPSPEYAIVEVLFLWQFGPILESLLSRSALGYRLDLRGGRLSKTRKWLFEYWPKRYEEFRTTPIDIAMKELSAGNSVVILSADLKSFYDTVAPSFLLNAEFLRELESAVQSKDGMSFEIAEYRAAIDSLLGFYSGFRQIAERRTGLDWPIGIPIGALTSRIVANLALATLDQSIEARDSTRWYGRYVDDFVIVAGVNQEELGNLDQVILNFVPHVQSENSTFRLNETTLRREGSEFRIQKAKCKAHHLSGVSGREFLASVRNDFGRLVSERRAFLDPAVLLEDGLSSVVRVGPPGRPLTVFRDADRTRLEHFELSTRLRSLERISVLVDDESASQLVKGALDETIHFLSGDDDWVENFEVALRMLQLGIRTGDWEGTDDLIRYMDNLWSNTVQLHAATGPLFHRERQIRKRSAVIWLRNYLHARRLEAICSVIRSNKPTNGPDWLDQGVINRTKPVRWRGFLLRARLLAATDLRAFDREDDAFGQNENEAGLDENDFGIDDSSIRERLDLVRKFIQICEELLDQPWAMSPQKLFLCTRPPSYFDVARRILYRTESGFRSNLFVELLDVVNAIRGTEYTDPVGEVIDDHTIKIPGGFSLDQDEPNDPQLILGNSVVSEECYSRAATPKIGSTFGNPILTIKRLRDITEILSDAAKIVQRNKDCPNLLVLPELSLPRPWFREVATYVTNYRTFGLIVGLEYLHSLNQPWVINQVYAVIPGPFNSIAAWPWTKGFPAREEAEQLRRHKVTFPPWENAEPPPRTVVISPYGRVSVLICSEMLEANRISDLFRRVEILAVPAWNKDTSSYDHLVQSVGLQLNAIVGIANNGHYSDCRAWAPKSIRWQRDLCRLIDRDTNRVIAVKMPLNSLRLWRKQVSDGVEVDDPEWRPLPPNW